MKKDTYRTAEIIRISATIGESILSASPVSTFNVSGTGQDLATPIDFEDNAFTLNWE